MNRVEFAQIVSALRTYYPKEKILPTDQAMELWFRALEDLPYKYTAQTLQEWSLKNKWSPTIAEIREGAMCKMKYGQLEAIINRHLIERKED
jgi:hypothetical protein